MNVIANKPGPPPYWALLERALIRCEGLACAEFFDHYFDDRGYLECITRWGGDDGPDDAAENVLNWTMLYALGGDEAVLNLYQRGWEGHLRQYTAAKTVAVPFALDGMYFREFPTAFDWFHHGEGFSAFTLQGLATPTDNTMRQRTIRYAELYMGDDQLAENYDKENRLIRSLFNGSRGPVLRKATPLDWAGDPIDVIGSVRPLHGERSYEEMLEHFKNYTDIVGDHPLNLGATSLAFNAYALTEENRFRDWALEYIDAWIERTRANGGMIPSNVGLDGAIGGACDGKWYGGVYGWGFSVPVVPDGGGVQLRNVFLDRSHYGFGNALLLTGRTEYIDVWREMLERVNKNSVTKDGATHYPHMYGDEGWSAFGPDRFAAGALETYYWSLDREVLDLLPNKPRWIRFLDGEDPSYPVEALQRDLAALHERVEAFRNDSQTPDTRLSDNPNDLNPAITETLTMLMLGGLPTGRVGYPLHCRLRYFDPDRRRAGVPDDVAALVRRLDGDGTVVTLVNISPSQWRRVVVQGGAYGEHDIESVECDGEPRAVHDRSFTVCLGPSAIADLRIRMRRYANTPSLRFPWDGGTAGDVGPLDRVPA